MKNTPKFLGFIGTYTKGDSQGIYSFIFNTATGQIEKIKTAARLNNPTFLSIARDNRFLYSVVQDGSEGGVAAFSLNSASGELLPLNRQTTAGPQPSHLQLDSKQQYLLTANYHKGTVAAYTIDAESGQVNSQASLIQHNGASPSQTPHPHYASFTPDEKYVAVVDLGIDQVLTYEIRGNNLHKVSHLELKHGCGPRHLDFHPNGKFAYLMTEYSSEVIALNYHAENGTFSVLQTILAIPADFTGNNQGSAIHTTSDGRFIYAANRGHNSMAVFAVDPTSGRLSLVEHVTSAGNWPRDFSLDPSEQYIIGSNQESGNLVIYKRNPETGRLVLLQSDIKVPHPVCIKFVQQPF